MRQPGVEPGSTAWKATMLTATPLTPDDKLYDCVQLGSTSLALTHHLAETISV